MKPPTTQTTAPTDQPVAQNAPASPAAQPHAPKDSPKAIAMAAAARRHVLPFAVWIGLLFIVDVFNLAKDPENEKALNLISYAAAYAWRTGLGLLALLIWRPWRHYPRLRRQNLLPALGVGAGVFLLWIGLESEFLKRILPGIAELYERWCVLPFGELRKETLATPYAPSVCGSVLTLTRLAGSAFVIAIIEEFFWRGFLYRWIQHLDFLDVDAGRPHWPALAGTAVMFAALHTEWAVAALTGLLYCLLYIRTRDIWAAALAHITTNLLLGIYVLATGHYHFW